MADKGILDQDVHPSQVAVVIVPWPAQSHLNMLMNLSFKIASYDIPVHYVSSPQHIRQVNLRSHDDDYTRKGIFFNELPLSSFSYYHELSSDLPPLLRVLPGIRHPVFQLLQELASKYRKIVIIYDSLMTSVVQDVQSIPNAEAYCFHVAPPFTVFLFVWENLPKIVKPFLTFLLDDDLIPKGYVPSIKDPYAFTREFGQFMESEFRLSLTFQTGRLYNSNKVIDEKYMNSLGTIDSLWRALSLGRLLPYKGVNRRVKDFSLGPFNPVKVTAETKINTSSSESDQNPRWLDWLNEQTRDTVIYVAFGTQVSMDDHQVKELAKGLEKSGHKFLWVVRGSDKGDISLDDDDDRVDYLDDMLPKGFSESVESQGLVVREWVPQLKILAHSSVGGFMSHCGWGSCLESISMGVPLVTWPLHFDQPWNSILVTQKLNVGLPVADWEEIRNGMVTSDRVEAAVKRLMGSEEGQQLRRRTVELGRDLQASMTEGGAVRCAVDDVFIAHILG